MPDEKSTSGSQPEPQTTPPAAPPPAEPSIDFSPETERVYKGGTHNPLISPDVDKVRGR